ncbi:hypothetical protein G7B40_029520 [Aetokthonos hydrillicola Thurmond2011]|jgi:hypothetical protein|uniref:Uncharacterized protein n=1 Tax=Aetokthonos hydrillicola Thurmond2011 TaxID=2712845 RepID=A0AAP5MCR6_9CYAN|nr:hypothetical protein [Aetokthonos hydrillicola]MBO3462514.1 hypothetical protein [Aetokthonos hydrillicola CCALA 1050]MBW4587467.1 hypothetical protein [Aetokthonos hydrillicola CCALA 1050]MDR9898668.1 hypothetical protein [Aetokthonos hydrillicola Thurmond2011]
MLNKNKKVSEFPFASLRRITPEEVEAAEIAIKEQFGFVVRASCSLDLLHQRDAESFLVRSCTLVRLLRNYEPAASICLTTVSAE